VLSLLVPAWCGGTSPEERGHPVASPAVRLYDNLGSHHHPITTTVPTAQRYFDQGLRLVFAFNHEEAVASFEEARRLDPETAMAFWGIALALGPNINAPMSADQERRAYEAVRKARTLSSKVSPREQAYIDALATRYSPGPGSKRESLDAAYADAMRTLSKKFPEDVDAATLFAEALMDRQPWDYWTPDGRPKGAAEEIVSTLEGVLQRQPDHPGACHYYIHAVEASSQPERALPCARRLPGLMPGAGHLVHMPAHLYMRLGMYHEASEHNTHAASVDHEYLSHRRLTGIYPTGYYLHNLHFLWAASTMEGRSEEAIRAARELVTKLPLDEVIKYPFLEAYAPTLLFALTRFGRWEAVLREPPPPSKLRYTKALWHYVRGLARAATGQFDRAEDERARLASLAKTVPKDQTIGQNSAAALLRIAGLVLAGEQAARRTRYAEAMQHLEEAVRLQDALRYNEPQDWYYPVRHSLGAVLLSAGRAAQADAVYREDLKQNPENGWALYGLEQSLRVQNKSEEAAAVEERFRKAWSRADVTLTASRF
jgi:tetratricopeptide (TPR) repeat protein